MGLVRAKQDEREGRHLLRLPRSALRIAAPPRQRSVRAVPSGGQVRCARAYPPRAGNARRGMRGLSHADDDLHAGRRPPRSFAAHPAPGSHGEARDPECVQPVPREEDAAVGGCGNPAMDGATPRRLPEFRRGAARGHRRDAGRARRADDDRRRSRAAGDRARERAGTAGSDALAVRRRHDDPRAQRPRRAGAACRRRRARRHGPHDARSLPAAHAERPGQERADRGGARACGAAGGSGWRQPTGRHSRRRSTNTSPRRNTSPTGRKAG